MHKTDWDDALRNAMAELQPTDAIVHTVTPWRKAMRRILFGLALTTVTFNFLYLQYLLPAVGTLLLLLGFRTLRRETPWFGTCFAFAAIRAVIFYALTVLDATIWQSAFHATPQSDWFGLSSTFCVLALFFCFWRGLRELTNKIDPSVRTSAAGWLVAWYLAISVLAYLRFDSLLLLIPLIIAYIAILICLREISLSLDDAGYALTPTPVKISDHVLAAIIGGTVFAAMLAAMLLGCRHSMDFSAVAAPTDDALVAELTALGFPEEILADLTAEDLADLCGAQEVLVTTTSYPVNEGRQVTTKETRDGILTITTTTVYDEKELQITGIAVRLNGETERWKLFHHFSWPIDPGFWGSDAVQIWTADRSSSLGWTMDGELSGQVLCEIDGMRHTAPYAFLGRTTYNSHSMFFGDSVETDVFAEFSFPRKATARRGYVSYTVHELNDGWIVDSWMNYIHQTTPFQYPALSAAEHKRAGGWNHNGAFCVVQTALQFFPDSGLIE